ncbi:hypothetical protein P153DRAFT_368339 [Dothidotthia symphoricarpi CBS 119687]|uniref:Uncharacterized protein n=1 Tax=Dothidotthia symphoricarpi CBS 119687 TaxID=1392245 RepID=A0A6A6AAR5_9PLEO|nr:uncharacterized protein P153DRAFT_368339 [Dothidotthia symphoricarpi CBS 119687]KAF2127791.1 hypothetical protein P153DRAFT_368339 [Dothidotthia symphoricarpi CBS 119687]
MPDLSTIQEPSDKGLEPDEDQDTITVAMNFLLKDRHKAHEAYFSNAAEQASPLQETYSQSSYQPTQGIGPMEKTMFRQIKSDAVTTGMLHHIGDIRDLKEWLAVWNARLDDVSGCEPSPRNVMEWLQHVKLQMVDVIMGLKRPQEADRKFLREWEEIKRMGGRET